MFPMECLRLEIFYVCMPHLGKTSHAAVGRIALTMCLAAASGGITQSIVSGLVQLYNRHEHYNTNEIANAVLANLVAVTGCCPFIEPSFAILIGRRLPSRIMYVYMSIIH